MKRIFIYQTSGEIRRTETGGRGRPRSDMDYNDKEKIISHYDEVSPYYRSLWGEHLHHGFWQTGMETKEEAQTALTTFLAEQAAIEPGARILDVGCGFGGSSIYLARHYNAGVTGITISSVQVKMAESAAAEAEVDARFLLMDAENISLTDSLDVVWSIEAISHLSDKAGLFAKAGELLKPGGTLAIADWFEQENLSPDLRSHYIEPIEKGILSKLESVSGYTSKIEAAGLQVVATKDLTENCARTWDLCLDLIKDRALWQIAMTKGIEFLHFLQSFLSMRKGYSSGTFVYCMIIARKP